MTGVVLVTVAQASVCARIVLHFFARILLAGLASQFCSAESMAKNSAPVGLRVPSAKLARIAMTCIAVDATM